MTADLTLRPIADGDLPLLERIYAGTRDDLARLDWSIAEKDAFLARQFLAQHRDYRDRFADASFDLIVDGDEPVGRLYVRRTAEEFRLIDLALLPEHRGRGIGGALLRGLLHEAAARDVPVRLCVERLNPAAAWYARLGFRRVGGDGLYDALEWTAVPDRRPAGTGD